MPQRVNGPRPNGISVTFCHKHPLKTIRFKLHLRSSLVSGPQAIENLPPLPPNKQVVDILCDFLKYLYQCARNYIQESHSGGASLWDTVKNDIDFVLSHPNGWDGKEQSQMRQAAIKASLISDAAVDRERISFVSEGEASLHFAIQSGILSKTRVNFHHFFCSKLMLIHAKMFCQVGEGVVVVDAGGGTVDVSAYRQDPKCDKKAFEEIAASHCWFLKIKAGHSRDINNTIFPGLLHGSVFVSMEARSFFNSQCLYPFLYPFVTNESFYPGHLKESQFHGDLDHITRCFDQSTKLRFRDDHVPQYVKFGSARDTDVQHGIQLGQLKLEG